MKLAFPVALLGLILAMSVACSGAPEPKITAVPEPTPTGAPALTATPAPTSTPEPIPTRTPVPTPTRTPVPTPTQTPVPTPTQTPVPTPTQTPVPTPTQTPVPTPTQTPVPSPTQTPAPTPTQTPAPTPTQTPAPTPTQTPSPSLNTPEIIFSTYFNPQAGYGFAAPDHWEYNIYEEGTERMWLASDDGVTRLSLFVEVHNADMPLSDRLENAIAAFTPEGANVDVQRLGPVTLANGSEAERAYILYLDDEGDTVRLVQVAGRGGFTFALVFLTQANQIASQRETFGRVLASFYSHPPHFFEVPRHRAFTMPLGHPASLDPAITRDKASHFFVSKLFSGFVRIAEDLSVEPDLAERWEVDDSGVVYTFTLRDGVTFHDGRPITADDFKYSIERATEPELQSITALQYLGDIVGVREKLDGIATEVSGFEVVDERTVRISIDSPKEYFLAKLSYLPSSVVDRQSVEQLGPDGWLSDEINGSGPYKLLRWDPDEAVILQRFDEYHSPVPIEHLVSPSYFLSDARPQDMYLTDAWDGMAIDARSAHIAREELLLRQELLAFNVLSTEFVAMDGTRPPFDDPNVRRAFAMALDREGLIDEVYHGDLRLANGLLPPGIPGYSETLEGIPFDPDMARQLLAESKYAENLPEIIFSGGVNGGQPSTMVQFMLDAWQRELGVKVRAEPFPPGVELEEAPGHLYIRGWYADYLDPENFLDLLMHSENYGSRYFNPAFDQLLESARMAQDPDARLDFFREAEQLLMDDAGIIPLYHHTDYVLMRPHVLGFEISPLGQPNLDGITLQTIAR